MRLAEVIDKDIPQSYRPAKLPKNNAVDPVDLTKVDPRALMDAATKIINDAKQHSGKHPTNKTGNQVA